MEIHGDSAILLFSILLIVGVFTTKFSSKLGLPALVFFIAVGMILNQFLYYDNAELTQFFGIFALIIILFEGGLQTKWGNVRRVLGPSLALATVGVFVTTVAVGAAAKFILDISWLEGMLFGAIVGSTDAAAVFAVIGNHNVRRKLSSTLEVESGTNDPMAIFLTVGFISLIQVPEASLLSMLGNFIWQMGIGVLLGFGIGKVSVRVINSINLDSSGLYPVLSLAFAILAYAFTTLVGASGLLAVYIAAMIMGNADLTYRHSIVRFNEGFAWMMQILMFILLGLLVFPNQLLHIVWQGLLLSAILMVIARPLGVFISLLGAKFTNKEKVFLSWAGLKGAVPIVLATYPMLAGIENSQTLFNVVFFVVLTSALIQGGTIPLMAQKLGLVGKEKPSSSYSLELVSIGKTNSEIIEVIIPEHSVIAHKQLKDVEPTNDLLIVAVIRNDQILTPRGNTTILPGDILYILVSKKKRNEVKNYLLKQEEVLEM
ncbi:potassium/proton antiporter [Bacillus carboniphilus]|uniref:Potassium/proton antiporter n=1 Tax=Bacillus carboniphilus TaxID=86663 RepID=A0ABN0W3H6_9BACI